ncbi:MAG: hypothetical protein HC915_11825 [Anaerolineae bacterium]|nr:hypothetical protein [Anaerolineae bacterium]
MDPGIKRTVSNTTTDPDTYRSQTRPLYDYVNALLVHYASFHAPQDAQLFIVGTGLARASGSWDWARELPHTRTAEGNSRLCFAGETVQSYERKAIPRLPEFWRELRKTLQTRAQRLTETGNAEGIDVTLPLMLVVVDLLHLPADEQGAAYLREMSLVAEMIMQQGRELGAAILFLTDGPDQIPSACEAVLELERLDKVQEGHHERLRLAFRYAEVDVNTPRYVGEADLLPQEDALLVARTLADYELRLRAGGALPNALDLLELNRCVDIETLRFPQRWADSRTPQRAEWLRVPIGIGADGIKELIFDQNKSGVHGMIAGTTGSGKSELLLTLIVGLAINYDPSIINFLLVDFKGGTAFDEFRELPHCVDVITNLEGNAVDRLFASIKAELDRRTSLLSRSGSKHVVDYRSKNLHETFEPFPHLFVIIDEFAEMVQGENAALYKAQLESIARLGRAIGVSLILATQKPEGVVSDQMRANMKWKICLRVESPGDSRELLRTTEAAYLPPGTPGRGYFQIGNEVPELVQTAYASAPYRASRRVLSSAAEAAGGPPIVIWEEDEIRQDAGEEAVQEQELSKAIVSRMHEYAEENRAAVAPQRKRWPDPLPRFLPLDMPISTEYLPEEDLQTLKQYSRSKGQLSLPLNEGVAHWMAPNNAMTWEPDLWHQRQKVLQATVGLMDQPGAALQRLVKVDLMADGHLIVFGASGWGKTTFLRTLITSFAATHAPQEFQVYILDFAGRALDLLGSLPHVGAVISAEEDDRYRRLLIILRNTIEERKKLVLEAADNLVVFNQQARTPEARLPAILVVIDNFAEIKENYEDSLPTLVTLMREGRNLGLFFAATAPTTGAVGGKLFNLFSNRMVLTLTDAADYSAVVGRGGTAFNEIEGRGLIAVRREVSQVPLEFRWRCP